MSHARSQRRKALKREPLVWFANARRIRIERLTDKLTPLYGLSTARMLATNLVIRVRPGGEGL